MNKKKLAKLRRELRNLRGAKYNLKLSQLIRFASKVGRKVNSSRGKEPTYVSAPFPELSPLSIPGHKSVNPFTANSILDALEADLDKWEDWLERQESKTNEDRKCLPPAALRPDRDPGES